MGAGSATWADKVSLVVPQGWATRGLLQVMNGAPLADILLTFAVLLVIGSLLFGLGVLRFQKRYA
jgi:hypothetical protein